jgi:putative oxidoreductase
MDGRAGDIVVLAGRWLLAVLFLGGAAQKIADPGPAMALLAGRGLPEALIWTALLYNALAGLALVAGVAVRPVAVSLAVYCGATSLFHFIPEDPWQMSIFVKNWAIAGGCLVLAAHGPGRYALGGRQKDSGGT